MTDKAATRIDNTKLWLELEALKLGTDDQRARWKAGTLPDDELAALARAELFKPFEGIPRWSKERRLKRDDAFHRDSDGRAIVGRDCDTHAVEFNSVPCTLPVDKMLPDEAETYRRILAAIDKALWHPWCQVAGVGFGVTITHHTAVCKVCNTAAGALSARVVVQWAGRTLTREYALFD